MITQQQFMQRTGVLYDSMGKRFRARHWKSGKRAGRVRVPGQQVPFTKEQFRAWAIETIGYQAKPCPYCSAPIDVLNMSIDHRVPVSRGGSLALSNLDAICADCNRLKGELTGKEFRAFLDGMHTFHPDAQRDVFKRMRAGAMGLRNRFFNPKKSSAVQLSTEIQEAF
jgi:hypothetical protein